MQEIIIFYILVVIGILASSCSQILLKKSADAKHNSLFSSIINWRIIAAYTIFFLSLFINVTAMSKGVNLKDIPVLESLGYIFVPLLSMVCLKENITKRTLISGGLIAAGIIIFYL